MSNRLLLRGGWGAVFEPMLDVIRSEHHYTCRLIALTVGEAIAQVDEDRRARFIQVLLGPADDKLLKMSAATSIIGPGRDATSTLVGALLSPSASQREMAFVALQAINWSRIEGRSDLKGFDPNGPRLIEIESFDCGRLGPKIPPDDSPSRTPAAWS